MKKLTLLITALLLCPAISNAAEVRLQPLAEVTVIAQRRATAEVIAIHRAQLSSEIMAVVTEVAAEVGQQVRDGDLIVQLETADFELDLADAQAELSAARARLELARQRLDDALALSGNQFVSEELLAARRSELATEQAAEARAAVAVSRARRMLAKATIRAPFDGVVTRRSAQIGQLLSVGGPVAVLVGQSPLELEAQVPYQDLRGLQGADAPRFEGAGSASFPVRLLRWAGVIEGATDSVRVRLGFTGDLPLPGESGLLRWRSSDGLIPASLLVRRDGELGVFIAEGNRARFKPLSGAQSGRPAPHALDPESLIVTQGYTLLSDGDELDPSG